MGRGVSGGSTGTHGTCLSPPTGSQRLGYRGRNGAPRLTNSTCGTICRQHLRRRTPHVRWRLAARLHGKRATVTAFSGSSRDLESAHRACQNPAHAWIAPDRSPMLRAPGAHRGRHSRRNTHAPRKREGAQTTPRARIAPYLHAHAPPKTESIDCPKCTPPPAQRLVTQTRQAALHACPVLCLMPHRAAKFGAVVRRIRLRPCTAAGYAQLLQEQYAALFCVLPLTWPPASCRPPRLHPPAVRHPTHGRQHRPSAAARHGARGEAATSSASPRTPRHTRRAGGTGEPCPSSHPVRTAALPPARKL
jgi:hypothetical protein